MKITKLRTKGYYLLTCLIVASLLSGQALGGKQQELKILIWSDYLDPEIVNEFEQKKNVDIKLNYFVSDDDRDDILQDNNAEGYDVVLVNGANLHSYIKRGWLAKIPEEKIPNKVHIKNKFFDLFPESHNYAIPYFWGTLGIAYRSDLVDKPINSWKDLFQPSTKMQGKIAMLGSSRDLVGMALKANGNSANSESKKELKAAEQLIQQQAPYVKSYSYISLQENSGLVTGEIIAAMAFNGDALALQEFNDNISYVVPQEGGNLWVDYMAVLAHSTHKALAMQFIDFINTPEIAARQAEFVYYPTPHGGAEKLLTKEFLENPEIYPPHEILEKSESYGSISPRAMKKRHEIFSRVSR